MMINVQTSTWSVIRKDSLGLVLIVITTLISCTKQTENKFNSLILTGIKSAKGSEMISIKIDSGVISTTPISCYLLSSTVMDPSTNGYGYVGCDTLFRLINPLTGEEINSFKVPWGFSQTVINSENNTLIGRYTIISYEEDPDTIKNQPSKAGPPVYTNYVRMINLSTGEKVAENQIDIGEGAWACSYYFDKVNNGYVLLRADNVLISINPQTGEIFNSVNIGKTLSNVSFDSEGRRVIGLTYSTQTDRNYIEVFDPDTGNQLSNCEIAQRDNYYACVNGYDAGSNSYILVNTNNEVLFIDISSGIINKSYKLDGYINDIKFWSK
jgi:hypothetical protein